MSRVESSMEGGGTSSLVRLDVGDDGVAVVTLNNPSSLNALTEKMGDRFVAVVDQLVQRSDVRAVVLTGEGRAFSAGGDLGFLEQRAFHSTAEAYSPVH